MDGKRYLKKMFYARFLFVKSLAVPGNMASKYMAVSVSVGLFSIPLCGGLFFCGFFILWKSNQKETINVGNYNFKIVLVLNSDKIIWQFSNWPLNNFVTFFWLISVCFLCFLYKCKIMKNWIYLNLLVACSPNS